MKGRPTSYKHEYCQQLIDYFVESQKPTIEDFCKINKIPISTFYDWLNVHKDLSEAKKKCWELRRESFLNEVENLIVTPHTVKVNAFPLALIARRYGIKTKDDTTPPPPPPDEFNYLEAIADDD